MEDKMKGILRTAAYYNVTKLCISAFGLGPVFKNPAGVTAEIWKRLLFHDAEFYGAFEDVIFAIDTSSASVSKTTEAELAVYRDVFLPRNVVPTIYRESYFEFE